MNKNAATFVITLLSLSLILILFVVIVSTQENTNQDCLLVQKAGPMIWSHNFDGLPVQPDGIDIAHLREIAAGCGYPQSMWAVTPTWAPTATFSPGCYAEGQQYLSSEVDPRRQGQAVVRIRECRAALMATATASAP